MRRRVLLLACCLVAEAAAAQTFQAETRTFFTTADGLPSNDVRGVTLRGGRLFAITASGTAAFGDGRFAPAAAVTFPEPARASDGREARAAADGLFLREKAGEWQALRPTDGARSWAPHDVRAVAFDARGRLWFASPQGVGVLESGRWRLYTPAEGLPYDDFTSVAPGEDGVVWFGTRKGAIRFDNRVFEYRQGRRWLPHDEVRAIAVEPAKGTAWFATAGGVGRIERKPMTLAQKAAFFEEEIEKRHKRTPYGYVLGVTLERPGDASRYEQRDSDNDGLWTSMYGAAQCFAWAATRRPEARARAVRAFEALRFLGTVTQGGEHPAPRGFVARTVLPADGKDPNSDDSPERDQAMRKRDRYWKSLSPRWPKSADGRWYWKADTSSDELDGHFFFYALYNDLVVSSEDEKQALRAHVGALAGHLLEHDFRLIDHDGQPTRWGVFDPQSLNHEARWRDERGLNSMSMLSYLKVAERITGEARYAEAYRRLIRDHAYASNVLIPKSNAGPGSGNQSDDEMAFMGFYGLLRYETDPALRATYALALHERWTMERPELNPLFNYIAAAAASGTTFEDAFSRVELGPTGEWREESLDTLRRYPLDRVDWRMTNSHRKDIVPLPAYARDGSTAGKGSRVTGTVLPIDERFVEHWNHDPWQLDQGGEGRRLADGSSFLLPYYMGLYYRFLPEP